MATGQLPPRPLASPLTRGVPWRREAQQLISLDAFQAQKLELAAIPREVIRNWLESAFSVPGKPDLVEGDVGEVRVALEEGEEYFWRGADAVEGALAERWPAGVHGGLLEEVLLCTQAGGDLVVTQCVPLQLDLLEG